MTNQAQANDAPRGIVTKREHADDLDGRWLVETFDTGVVARMLIAPSPAWDKKHDKEARP